MKDQVGTPGGKAGPAFLIPAVIAFAAGIGWAGIRQMPNEQAIWAVIAAGSLAVLALHLKPAPLIASFLTLPLFFLTGSLHVRPFLDPPGNPSHIYSLVKNRQEASLCGILMESPSVGDDQSRLIMQIEEFSHAGVMVDASGLIQLSLRGKPPSDLMPGDRFMARAVVSRVRSNSTPGAFDIGRLLACKSIWVTGWVRSPVLLMKIHDSNPLPWLHRIRFSAEKARHRINSFLDNTADKRVAGLYRAILTGDMSGVSPDQLENFRATGCLHLLAISGLNVGLLAAFVTFLITKALKCSSWILLHIPVLKTAALASLPILVCYAMVAGFNPPVVRALIMTGVFVLAIVSDSQWSIATNVAIAALIILVIHPASLYTVSFQLSFAAIIAIILIYPELARLLNPVSSPDTGKHSSIFRLKSWAAACLILSVAATLGTMPLVMYNFNRFSPASPVSTLIAEPLLCFWALILGLAACPLALVLPAGAAYLIHMGCLGLLAADRAATLIARIPFSSVWVSTPTAPEVVCSYIFLISLTFLKKHRAVLVLTMLSLLAVIGIPLSQKAERSISSQTVVTFLDVGQGSSTVLELPGGHTILIDGGGAGSPRYNTGERVIGPFLWKRRITGLDAVIITHPNSDHYNGLFFILKRFRPQTLWINGDTESDTGFGKLLELADQLGIKVEIPGLGTTFFQADDVRLKCVSDLHQAASDTRTGQALIKESRCNNQSLVVRLDCGPLSFLFPGDIQREAETLLVEQQMELDADVLLSPHHGADTSNSDTFLKAVSPRYIMVSAGADRPTVYTEPDTMLWCKNSGINVFSTANNGAVSFTVDKGELRVIMHDGSAKKSVD